MAGEQGIKGQNTKETGKQCLFGGTGNIENQILVFGNRNRKLHISGDKGTENLGIDSVGCGQIILWLMQKTDVICDLLSRVYL